MTTEAGTTSSELDLLHGALPEALARDDFANLAVLLRYAADGCFAIAVYNSAAAREQVVSALRQLVAPLPAFEWTYSPHDPYPFSYLDRLTDEQRRERAVAFFFGLDKADAAALKSLDYNRERLVRQPHGLVFWVTPAFLGQMARGAPHFWSQRSGVFDFTVAHPELAQHMRDAAWQTAPDTQAWMIDREDKERELRLYQALLTDYEADPATPARTLFDLHARLSNLLYFSNRTAEAKRHALAALELSEQLDQPADRANTLRALGDLGLREADLAGARASYEAALPIYRTIGDRLGEANTLCALGDLGLREDDLAGARASYEAALPIYRTIGARLGEANTLQGFGDERMTAGEPEAAVGQYAAAQALYEQIQDRYSQSRNLIRIARAEQALGRSGDSMAHLVAAARLADAIQDRRLRGQALDLLAEVCDAAKDRGALDDLLDALVASHPEDAELCKRRGDARYAQKRYADALADLQAATTLNPRDAWAWNSLANALESLKRYDEAIAAYAQAIALRPDEALLYRNRANVLLDLGRTDEAEADVAQAVKLDPEHPYTRGRQGWLALARGLFAEAVEHFEVVAKAGDEWRYGLALAQFAAGEAGQARATLSAAVPDMSDDDKANARLWLERVVRWKPDLASAAEDFRALLH